MCSQKSQYFAGQRVALQHRLLEDVRSVHIDLEPATTRRQQNELNGGERLPNGVRQTGGSWFVVSNDAVFDLHAHGPLSAKGLP
jgi:hypothetical protein